MHEERRKKGKNVRGCEEEKRSTCLGLREDDACFALHEGGSNLQYNCLHCVGTAPTLRGEQLHTNGPSC